MFLKIIFSCCSLYVRKKRYTVMWVSMWLLVWLSFNIVIQKYRLGLVLFMCVFNRSLFSEWCVYVIVIYCPFLNLKRCMLLDLILKLKKEWGNHII